MSVVLQLKGKLHDLKLRREKIRLKADTTVKGIKNHLATAATEELSEIDAEAVALLSADLVTYRHEYIRLSGDIRKIEKELGGE